MNRGKIGQLGMFASAMAVLLCAGTALGQPIEEDWVVFQDSLTGSNCGVVNAANAELIVLFQSGNMVVVSGADVVLQDLVVYSDNSVSYLSEPAGYIDFAEDGDGLPAVFWLTLTGTVVQINTFTGEPTDSGLLPSDRINTVCDACTLIDQSSLCDNTPGDGGNGGGTITLPDLCGAGAPAALVVTAALLPLVSLGRRRRRL